jgi:hypothetical protein
LNEFLACGIVSYANKKPAGGGLRVGEDEFEFPHLHSSASFTASSFLLCAAKRMLTLNALDVNLVICSVTERLEVRGAFFDCTGDLHVDFET